MGFGEKVAKAEVKDFDRLLYWQTGKYLVQIDVVKVIDARKDLQAFIVEGINLTSRNEKCPTGMAHSQAIMSNWDSFYPDIKKFIAAVGAVDPEELTPEDIDAVVSAENPFNGEIVYLEVWIKEPSDEKKKEGKKPFTVHRWIAATDDQKKQAKKLQKELDL